MGPPGFEPESIGPEPTRITKLPHGPAGQKTQKEFHHKYFCECLKGPKSLRGAAWQRYSIVISVQMHIESWVVGHPRARGFNPVGNIKNAEYLHGSE